MTSHFSYAKRTLPFHRLRWHTVWFVICAIAAGLFIARFQLPLVGVVLIGIASIVLIIIRPLFGVALALLVGPFGALEDIVLGQSIPAVGQLIFLVTVFAWLGRSVLRRKFIVPRTFLNIPLSLFIFLAALSLLSAASLDHGIKELVKWIEILLLIWMIVDLKDFSPTGSQTEPEWQPMARRNRPAYRNIVLGMVLLAGVSQALIGFWQFAIWKEGPDHFLVLERFYRAFGTFMQPNPYGGYMAIIASLALGSLLGTLIMLYRRVRQSRTIPFSSLIWLFFLAISFTLTCLATVMSWSRGAWLGFGAAMAVLLVFLPRKIWKGIALMVLGLFLLIFSLRTSLVPSSVSSRLISFTEDIQIADVRGVEVTVENFAVIERIAHWQAGAAMARDNLVDGVGFGNYEIAYSEYDLLNWPHPLGHAHNYYLNVLAEAGILGLLGYLFLWSAIFYQAVRQLGRLDWPDRGIALGLLAAWTTLTVHHLVDNLYVNNLYLTLGVMLGLQHLLDRVND